jgi:hypothetical protein
MIVVSKLILKDLTKRGDHLERERERERETERATARERERERETEREREREFRSIEMIQSCLLDRCFQHQNIKDNTSMSYLVPMKPKKITRDNSENLEKKLESLRGIPKKL